MQSSNPVFGNAPTLKPTPSVGQLEDIYRTPRALTLDDVVVKTSLLLGLVVLFGAGAWALDAGPGLVMGAFLAGFVLGLVNCFKRQVSVPLVLAYGAFEGVFLGGLSSYMEAAYPGIVVQAAVGTTGVFSAVLWAYKSGRLRATPRFTKMVVGALFGLMALVVVNLLASWLGGGDGLGIRDGGPLAIVFSLAMIGVGALTFVLDFDLAEEMVRTGVPEKEAWRVAFALVAGLVFLYLEILRLLSYFRDE